MQFAKTFKKNSGVYPSAPGLLEFFIFFKVVEASLYESSPSRLIHSFSLFVCLHFADLSHRQDICGVWRSVIQQTIGTTCISLCVFYFAEINSYKQERQLKYHNDSNVHQVLNNP